MHIYKLGDRLENLSRSEFLKSANAVFYGDAPAESIRIDGGDLSGPWTLGTWAVERGEFDLTYAMSEYCTILEGRVIVAQGDRQAELAAGDSFFTPKGETVRWQVIEPVKKSFVIIP